MSESEEHRTLVRTAEQILRAAYPRASIVVDIRTAPGAPVPPTINGFRPDAFVRSDAKRAIAEAKTRGDLDRTHTQEQMRSFILYLDKTPDGLFMLSVTGTSADRAKTILRFAHHEIRPSRTRVAVFDQCDIWMLQRDALTWRIWPAGRAA